MKLDIVRGAFLIGALGLASYCAAEWSEPDAGVISASSGMALYPVPPLARQPEASVRPDQDLLLFIYSLSQGMGSRG